MPRFQAQSLTPVRPSRAERIVLIEDCDAFEAKILGQVFDPGLGLGAVARANIDDVMELRCAEEFSSGEWTDERHIPGT